MVEFLAEYSNWLLALHIISVIAWMAGMLYLPRLFVYHIDTEPGSQTSETFKVMERRLLRAIINPAMIVAWIMGILLIWRTDWFYMSQGWMHGKLLAVVLMTGVHHVLARHVKRFARDERAKSSRYYRVLNEIPTVLMIVTVFLVVFGTR
ncbi:MAG: protoporphyrinogen oxidase HemJ [Alphaproteobacteria bacterium]